MCRPLGPMICSIIVHISCHEVTMQVLYLTYGNGVYILQYCVMVIVWLLFGPHTIVWLLLSSRIIHCMTYAKFCMTCLQLHALLISGSHSFLGSVWCLYSLEDGWLSKRLSCFPSTRSTSTHCSLSGRPWMHSAQGPIHYWRRLFGFYSADGATTGQGSPRRSTGNSWDDAPAVPAPHVQAQLFLGLIVDRATILSRLVAPVSQLVRVLERTVFRRPETPAHRLMSFTRAAPWHGSTAPLHCQIRRQAAHRVRHGL